MTDPIVNYHPALRREPKPKYEYRVQYRRFGWRAQFQVRIFQTAWGVRQFLARLCRVTDDLDPIAEFHVDRRVVGQWQRIRVDHLPAAGPSHKRRKP